MLMYVSYLRLISSWKLRKSPGNWYRFYLDCILGKIDQLFKYIVNLSLLGLKTYRNSP